MSQKQMLTGASDTTDGGCPVWNNVEVMETIRTDENCTNRWNLERYVLPNNRTRINTRKDRLESKVFLGKTGSIPPMMFNCPCEPGSKVPRMQEAGYSQDFGFQWWKVEAELDACEIAEYVDTAYIAEQNSIPWEDQEWTTKWLAHQAERNDALNEAALNRYEMMASSIRYFGAYVVQREKEDDMFIDFGKSPCTEIVLKESLSCDGSWPDTIYKALKAQYVAINKVMPDEMTIGKDAFEALSNHNQYRKIGLNCECSEPGNEFLEAQGSDCGIVFAGRWNNVPLYLDCRTTTCPVTGRSEFIFPQDAIMMSNESNGGQDIKMAHTTNYIPSKNFPVGDFFYDNGVCRQKNNESWWATLEGSIMMVPRNVNRTVMVRGVGDEMSPGPDCGDCNDILLNAEGMIASPQPLACNTPEEEVVWESPNYEICKVLIGLTPDVTHCSEGNPDKCFPGKAHKLTPWNTCCPGDDKRVVSAEFLAAQGFTADCLERLVRLGGLKVTDRVPGDEDANVTPAALRGKPVSKEARQAEVKRLNAESQSNS